MTIINKTFFSFFLFIFILSARDCLCLNDLIIKAPPYQGEAFSFCTVSSSGGAAHGRHLSSIPCRPDIYKTAFSIHLVFNILDASINS